MKKRFRIIQGMQVYFENPSSLSSEDYEDITLRLFFLNASPLMIDRFFLLNGGVIDNLTREQWEFLVVWFSK